MKNKIEHKGLCQSCYRRKRQEESPKKKCECSPECQEMIPSITFDGKPMRFKLTHHFKLNIREKCHNWKNGRKKTGGYMKIRRKHHKYCDSSGYVFEHRYIMELQLGRYLLPEEKVHHIDRNKLNNDISNLMLFSTHSEHMVYERDIDMSDRKCFLCGSKKTYKKKNAKKPTWHIKDNHFICARCRDRLRYDLKRKNIWRKKSI